MAAIPWCMKDESGVILDDTVVDMCCTVYLVSFCQMKTSESCLCLDITLVAYCIFIHVCTVCIYVCLKLS